MLAALTLDCLSNALNFGWAASTRADTFAVEARLTDSYGNVKLDGLARIGASAMLCDPSLLRHPAWASKSLAA